MAMVQEGEEPTDPTRSLDPSDFFGSDSDLDHAPLPA
jgi:hypothetical protein